MGELENARHLLENSHYNSAGALLDRLLRKEKENSELWYLRGLVSMRLKNYDAAHECFNRALFISRKPHYHKIKAMSHLEVFQVESALEHFLASHSLSPKDATVCFFIFVCYLLLDNPKAKDYVEKAYLLDRKKTKLLLQSFYSVFLKSDKSINPKLLKDLETRMSRIG